MSLKSAIYTGLLQHERYSPKSHAFRYEVVMFYIDLSEVEQIFNLPFLFWSKGPSLAGFKRRDYLKGDESLSASVRKLILEKTGRTHTGAIRLLTQIRYFGFCFNPVSFYYCFDEDENLEFIVSEITNTPWNERHAYVVSVNPGDVKSRFEFKKEFHVSPFLPMDLQYVWTFNPPKPELLASKLKVHMEDWDLNEKKRVFQSNLVLAPKPMTKSNLAKTVLSYPLLTLKTIFAIYYQAVLLKLKKVPFYSNPLSGEK